MMCETCHLTGTTRSELFQQKGSKLTSMLTGSMVLMWTLGAEDERSRWPNWLRWSSSLGRKLGGMGMDLDGDTVVWHMDLEHKNGFN